MNERIANALNRTRLENYYISREDDTRECIVYNFISSPLDYADNTKKSTKYTILLNIYVKDGITDAIEEVIRVMTEAGFKESQTEVAKKIENELYNIPIKFKGYILES